MRPLHRSILARLKSWVHWHHTAVFLLAGSAIIIATAATAAAMWYHSPQKTSAPVAQANHPVPAPAPAPPVYYSPLTGEKVVDQPSTQRAVTGVMIENSLDARPQSGLKAAGVVFEAIAEGGITRFLALYQEARPQLIGPVRSLRLYDVDWFAPFQASIAHVGGSQAALQEVRNGTYRDIDQFFNSGYYSRVTDRYAPHNVYTTFDKLDSLNQRKGYSTSTFTAWPRQDGSPAKTVTANSIDVKISGPAYNNHYVYEAASNSYIRYQGGAPHLDREGGNIKPNVVIVMDVTETTIKQDGNREQITTVGSGKAHVFQNGVETDATWTKKDRGSQIAFIDGSGKEIPFNRGQTWLTAVPANQGGKVTWQATK